jgi:hypothetical protein
MRIAVAAGLALVVSMSHAAFAHEGHAHKLMGTVTAVQADMNHVEVKTTDGKVTGFHVTPETKYLSGSKAATFKDLAVGTRVVVTTKMEGAKTIATEVKMGAAASGKDAPKANPHQH